MAKPKARIKVTYQDYRNLPESDPRRYELIDGELLMVPAPNWRHQEIAGRLEFRLRLYVRERPIGVVADAPLDVVLSNYDVLQPDILLVTHERKKVIREEGLRGAPDLVVEVLSPSTARRDQTVKSELYARHGVRELWLVDPGAETVEIFQGGDGEFVRRALLERQDLLESPILPGFSLHLSELFDDTA